MIGIEHPVEAYEDPWRGWLGALRFKEHELDDADLERRLEALVRVSLLVE